MKHLLAFVTWTLVAHTGLEVQAAAVHRHPSNFLRVEESLKEKLLLLQSNSTGEPAHHVGANLHCGKTEKVGSHTDKYEDCPADCPYFAQNRKDAEHCTFLCVKGEDCETWNPNKPIPDKIKSSKTCRGPMVQFCSQPTLDGKDTCARCQTGWKVDPKDGKCYFQHYTAIMCGVGVVVALVVAVIVWIVDWSSRETINEEGIQRGLDYRSRAKIHMPKYMVGEGNARTAWPMDTNLCTTDIAGPGMLLHFRFQVALIIWPLGVAFLWTILSCFHNELFILGTRKFGTPRHNCILVAWGYETQQRLMWTKVLFLVIVYFASFIYFMLFSISQYRTYQKLDATQKTMKDFGLSVKGIPEIAGSEKVEEELKKVLESPDNGFKNIVGISICWNFKEDEDAVVKFVRKDQEVRTIQIGLATAIDHQKEAQLDEERRTSYGALRNKFHDTETSLFGPDDDEDDETIEAMLGRLQTSTNAFVVFNTEEDKMAALNTAESNKIMYRESELSFEDVQCEPLTVNWQNFGDNSIGAMLKNFAKGFFGVYLPALAVWFFLFYVPYAWSLYNFNYDNGAELPSYYGIIFTMVVVGGNATMYVVCDICGDIIGFKYKDTKQVTYMLMYLTACMINVLLDMIVTWKVAKKMMVGYDFRTYHGKRLEEIDSFTDKFETYAMQRSLAENVFIYSFPSTFLVPFLLEPIITVLVPFKLGQLIVRTHREIHGTVAEAYFAAFDFDLGRYADILLNVFLGILIFWFPGGYTWTLFYGMFISHIVIYTFDHWRVLDVIPSVQIVSMGVDWWAQIVLAACVAMILSALVFKANCETYSGYCVKDFALIELCTFAGLCHFCVHVMLICFLVPRLCPDLEDDNERMAYEAVAREEPFTWFSTNPVYCLRSQYVYKHEPFCRFASVGKEHLLQRNPKIGLYFEDIPAETEDFNASSNLKKMRSGLSGSLSRFTKRGETPPATP